MSISYINHKGKKVLFVDYSKCANSNESLVLLYELANHYKNSTEKLIVLSNFAGTFGSMKFMSEAKRLKKEVFDHKVSKSAAIGIGGLQNVLLKGYNKVSRNKLIHFNSKEEALNYLVS